MSNANLGWRNELALLQGLDRGDCVVVVLEIGEEHDVDDVLDLADFLDIPAVAQDHGRIGFNEIDPHVVAQTEKHHLENILDSLGKVMGHMHELRAKAHAGWIQVNSTSVDFTHGVSLYLVSGYQSSPRATRGIKPCFSRVSMVLS